MMRALADIAAKGVKTDKGFKEIHITQVAKALTKLVRYEVSATQITNHLRKWKVRYQRIEKLRCLSGVLWDDDEKMIVLEEQHYLGHTQDNPKDAELLNKPIVNFEYMDACWSNKLATGKFAMGSNEALGKPAVVEQGIDLDSEEGIAVATHINPEFNLPRSGAATPSPGAATPSPTGTNNKRKRTSIMSEEDAIQRSNMSDALRDVAGAINNTCHTETHPDLYKAVMDLSFDMEERLAVLDYLTEHKGKGLNFLKMEVEVRKASFKRILAKNPDLL
ncbi:unnamed protein product [Alopecurus aequalis]